MSLATSHGPTSIAAAHQRPRRRHQAGAVAPRPATSPRTTRRRRRTARPSPGRPSPIGRSWRNSRDSASTNAAAERCVTATPFGRAGRAGGEDDPGVVGRTRLRRARAARPGPRGSSTRGARSARCRGHDVQLVADDRGDVGLVEDQPGALVGVVRVDRHVGGARHEHAEDRDVQVGRARPDPDPDPVAPPDTASPQADRPPRRRPRRARRRSGPRRRCPAPDGHRSRAPSHGRCRPACEELRPWCHGAVSPAVPTHSPTRQQREVEADPQVRSRGRAPTARPAAAPSHRANRR